jgi:hypothetical protein
MEFPAGMLVGIVISAFLAVIAGIPIMQQGHANQFRQDCISMAHGTVLKDSPHICRKGNTILFTAK